MRIVIGLLLAGSVSVWGAVQNTKHDLSAIAWDGAGDVTEDNGELCVYCHTPHAANTAFTGAPIWNKATPSGTFTLYGTTVAGTTAGNAGSLNAPSMACLSCHDGASAVNSVVNAPGSGLGDGFIGTSAVDITNAVLSTSTATNIGTDLTNDHPVSIEYAYNADPTINPAGLKAKDTTLTGWTGAGTIQDLLRTTGGVDYVECGSCHDPHDGADTSASATEVAFLRISNAGSALCMGCHDK